MKVEYRNISSIEFKDLAVGDVFDHCPDGICFFMKISQKDEWTTVDLEDGQLMRTAPDAECYVFEAKLILEK